MHDSLADAAQRLDSAQAAATTNQHRGCFRLGGLDDLVSSVASGLAESGLLSCRLADLGNLVFDHPVAPWMRAIHDVDNLELRVECVGNPRGEPDRSPGLVRTVAGKDQSAVGNLFWPGGSRAINRGRSVTWAALLAVPTKHDPGGARATVEFRGPAGRDARSAEAGNLRHFGDRCRSRSKLKSRPLSASWLASSKPFSSRSCL